VTTRNSRPQSPSAPSKEPEFKGKEEEMRKGGNDLDIKRLTKPLEVAVHLLQDDSDVDL